MQRGGLRLSVRVSRRGHLLTGARTARVQMRGQLRVEGAVRVEGGGFGHPQSQTQS
jgi:hypothetical protein